MTISLGGGDVSFAAQRIGGAYLTDKKCSAIFSRPPVFMDGKTSHFSDQFSKLTFYMKKFWHNMATFCIKAESQLF